MAAPSYSTDLATVTLNETNTGWSELTGHTTGGADATETDYYIQGTACVSQSTGTATGTTAGMEYDYGSNVTFNTGDHFFIWQIFTAPGAIDTFNNGGMRFGVGPSTGNIKYWKCFGVDSSRYPYGGWVNTAIDPTLTADYTEGTPTANYRIFASWPNLTAAVSKGNPHGVDAIRRGRGQILATGGDSTNGYATFAGMAAKNDANDATNGYNRWGLFQYQAGSYLWKGLMSLGSATTAVDFRDSNRNIVIDDTRRVASTFNLIEIKHASSYVTWTNINITALGTTSKGDLSIDSTDPYVKFDGCTFTDMGTFLLRGSTDVVGTTFRRCGLVTQNTAEIQNTLFDKPSGAVGLLCNNIEYLANVDFISDGTGHALELTSAHAGSAWQMQNITFSGYAAGNGSTGNEAIYNNSGGAVTLYVNSTNAPSVRNGTGASTTLILTSTSVTVHAQTASGTAIEDAQVFLYAGLFGSLPAFEEVTISNSGTTATVTHGIGNWKDGGKVWIQGASHWQNNGVFTISITDSTHFTYTMASAPGSNPTGTITATYVLLHELTDFQGDAQTTVSVLLDQAVYGWVRKGSATPYYKTGPIGGNVPSEGSVTFTAILVKDE